MHDAWAGISATLDISLRYLPSPILDVSSITKSIVNHVQTSLSRQVYNLNDLCAYQAAVLSAKDNILLNWNETQLAYARKQPKPAYYLYIEYLMGRTFDNALLNLGLKDQYNEGIEKLGFNLEDLVDEERGSASETVASVV